MKTSKVTDDEWMPEHYLVLQDRALKHGSGQTVTPMDWGLQIEAFRKPHVKVLSSAASKFRLAHYCEGLQGPETEIARKAGVGPSFFERYSAQVQVMLSFVAFETHLRMLDLDWRGYDIGRTGVDFSSAATCIREDLGAKGFKKLKKAMDNDKLKKRLKSFWEGDDREILATISAIRNSFSHGKMGISNSVSPSCAAKLKSFLLEMVAADCLLIAGSLEAQDPTKLPGKQ